MSGRRPLRRFTDRRDLPETCCRGRWLGDADDELTRRRDAERAARWAAAGMSLYGIGRRLGRRPPEVGSLIERHRELGLILSGPETEPMSVLLGTKAMRQIDLIVALLDARKPPGGPSRL